MNTMVPELQLQASCPVTHSNNPSLPNNETSLAKDEESAPAAPSNPLDDKMELERLGRMRPAKFSSLWQEIAFVFSICMSQIVAEYFVSGFNVIVPTLVTALNIPPQSSTWPAGAFSLVVACFLLVFGRLADMYGGKLVYICGLVWLVVWSIVAGFSQNELMIDFARALQGLGPAMSLPSGVMLLGSVYRPGPRKNMIFSIYGAASPFGFFVGAMITFLSLAVAIYVIPNDSSERRALNLKMDWWGSLTIVSGLILVVYAITNSSSAHNGWRSAEILVPLLAGVAVLGAAWYVEGYVAEMPLLPFEVFTLNMRFTAVVVVMIFTYGGLGIFLLYSTFYMQNILGAGPMTVVVWSLPMALGGCFIAAAGGFILHRVPGTILMIISGLSWTIAPLLFAIIPSNPSFWSFVFPSMLCATIGIDISFNITNVFITTALPSRQQGLAGALINSMLHLSIALFLGLAEVIANSAHVKGKSLAKVYKDVFWFEVAAAAVALVLMLAFVRLESAKSDKTADEKEIEKRPAAGL